MTKLRKRYDKIYQSLRRAQLQQGMRQLDELVVSDLFDYDEQLWVGYYTAEGLEVALRRYGLFDDIRRLGFEDVELELQLNDPDEQMLRLWSRRPVLDKPLLELVVSRGMLQFPAELADHIDRDYATVLSVQWLMMQHPGADFGADRLPLPGQHHPGLGIGGQVMELLRNTCRRVGLDGLVTVPAHFHNAVMYADEFCYIDPNACGAFRGLRRDLVDPDHLALAVASWAVDWQLVVDRADRPREAFDWFHEPMVCAVGEAFKDYFDSDMFSEQAAHAAHTHRFATLEQALLEHLANRGLVPWDHDRAMSWLAD